MFPIIIVGTTGALTLLITYLIGFPIAKLMLKTPPGRKKPARTSAPRATLPSAGSRFHPVARAGAGVRAVPVADFPEAAGSAGGGAGELVRAVKILWFSWIRRRGKRRPHR